MKELSVHQKGYKIGCILCYAVLNSVCMCLLKSNHPKVIHVLKILKNSKIVDQTKFKISIDNK